LFLHADDQAGHGGLCRGDYIHAFAAKLFEELAHRGITGKIDTEALERLVHGIAIVVVDRADAAAAMVLQHEAFEEIVDAAGMELQVDMGIAVDLTLALKVTDAAAEE